MIKGLMFPEERTAVSSAGKHTHSPVKSETYSINVYELCMLYDAQLWKVTLLCIRVEPKIGIQVDGEMAYSRIRQVRNKFNAIFRAVGDAFIRLLV